MAETMSDVLVTASKYGDQNERGFGRSRNTNYFIPSFVKLLTKQSGVNMILLCDWSVSSSESAFIPCNMQTYY